MRWKRLLAASLVTLLGSLLAIEGAARHQDLDRLQHEAIAVEGKRYNGLSWRDGSELGVAYLPDEFVLEASGLSTAYGRCDFGFEGTTVLVFGDSTTVQSADSTGNVHRGRSWVEMLQVPEEVQLCGIAEVGYHPADYAELLEGLHEQLRPELVLVLLCGNDLEPRAPRTGVRQEDGRVLLYEPPSHRLVVPGLWQPGLYEASEAFRFLHWRLAMKQADPHRMPIDTPGMVSTEEALSRLEGLASIEAWLLPSLGGGFQNYIPESELEAWKARGRLIQLEEPLEQYRRLPDDPVHMNERGHAAVAEQIQARIDELRP